MLVRFLIAIFIVLVLAAPRPAAADDTLTIISGGFPAAFPQVLGDVAEKAGFYKAEHLIVDQQYTGGAATAAVQLVASGKGDIASVGTEPIIQGYEKGVRLMAFFSRDPYLQQVLGVLDDSPIRTLADFKGATIGQLSLGQPGTIYTTVMLEGAGLKKTDFTFIAIGNGPQAIQAITSRKVDAMAFPFPELRTYEVVAHMKFRYFYQPILKDISDVAYVAAPATLQTKADAINRFCRASVKAAILIRENPQLAARYFVESTGQKVTDEAIATETHLLQISQDMLPAFNPANEHIGEVSLRNMQVLNNFMYDNAMTSVRVPAADVANNQCIAFANDFDRKAFIAQVKAMR